jgi:hypothetical protein
MAMYRGLEVARRARMPTIASQKNNEWGDTGEVP